MSQVIRKASPVPLVNDGIISAIGKTPLVRLSKYFTDPGFSLYAKLECLNPGGSVKDRPALNIIRQGMATNEIRPDMVIVESSSGNMGVGLALVCAYYGLRFICVIDPKTTAQNISLMQAYGADVELVSQPDPHTGEFLQARLNRVRELRASVKNSYWPNQYANLANPFAHQATMKEIVSELGSVDYLFCAISTFGTLRGCAEFIRDHDLSTQVYAVDAVGSVIFGGEKAKRLIPGHGAAVRPALFRPDLAAKCVHVTDLDCVIGCRRLVRTEAILAGGSSGAVLAAVELIAHDIPPGAICVTILPDRGDRYLDTIYSDEWVLRHFGDVSYLLESESKRIETCLAIA